MIKRYVLRDGIFTNFLEICDVLNQGIFQLKHVQDLKISSWCVVSYVNEQNRMCFVKLYVQNPKLRQLP